MFKEFREFAIKGNVMDLAVGVVIGASFGAVVKSLVDHVLMPPIGLLLGRVDFAQMFVVLRQGVTPGPYPTVELAQEAGAVVLAFGLFVNATVNFLIIAFAIFMIVRTVNRMRRKAEVPPPPGPTREQVLLEEIRDLLKKSAPS